MASYPSQWEVLEVDRRQCSCAAARQGLGVAGVWGKPWTCPPAKGRKTMEGYEPAGKSRLILSWLDYSEGPLQSLFVWCGLLTATRFQWKPSYGTHLQSNGFGGGTTIAVHVFPHAHAFEYFPPLSNHLFAQLCEVNEHTAWLLCTYLQPGTYTNIHIFNSMCMYICMKIHVQYWSYAQNTQTRTQTHTQAHTHIYIYIYIYW